MAGKKQTENIQDLKDKMVDYYRKVPVLKYAAMKIGRDESTIHRWLKDDENFASRVTEARADWVSSKVEKSKVEFALERMEKEVFNQNIDLTTKAKNYLHLYWEGLQVRKLRMINKEPALNSLKAGDILVFREQRMEVMGVLGELVWTRTLLSRGGKGSVGKADLIEDLITWGWAIEGSE